MATIRHEVWIDAPVEKIYSLLANADQMSTWWDKQTEVHAPEGLVWEHTPGSAWTGTTTTFALGDRASSVVASQKWAREIPLQTVLSFAHEGWDENSRFFAFCNTAWAAVLQMLADKAKS